MSDNATYQDLGSKGVGYAPSQQPPGKIFLA